MISQSAIDAYEQAIRRNLERYKTSDVQELRARSESMGARFHTKPYAHQIVCTYLGLIHPSLALFLEMGLGKSKIVLDIISAKMRKNPKEKALILVPYLVHLAGWKEQAAQHAPHLRTLILNGNSVRRVESLRTAPFDVVILNYQGLLALCTVRGSTPRIHSRQHAPSWLYTEMADWIAKRFSILVGDESTAFKEPSTKIFQLLRYIGARTPSRYILSGNPFGSTPHDLWSQMYFIDRGQSLCETLALFRRVYFSKTVSPWGIQEFIFRARKKPLLQRSLQHSSIRYRSDECLDLPPQTFSVVKIPWGAEAKQYYKALHQEAVLMKIDNKIDVENKFMKLRQLCSGFLITDESPIIFSDNPKVDAVVQLLSTIGAGKKVVIFHFFICSGDILSARMKKEGIKHVRIGGSTKNKPEHLARFLNEKDVQVIILNEAIGAMGLNLQVASHCIFFECPLSPIVRDQACRRIFGRLSTLGHFNPAFYYDLMTEESIEQKIYYAVKAGRQLLQDIMAGRDSF